MPAPTLAPPPAPPLPDPPAPEAMRVRALKVAAWRIGGYGAAQVIRLASNVLLARLLVPEHFGVAALVTVWAQGLEMFSDIGLAPGVIRSRRGEDAVFVNTAWTLGVVRGIVLCAIGCALAVPVARIYGEPMLALLLPISSLGALLGGVRSTSIMLLSRAMKGGFIAGMELGGQMFAAAVSITWAWFDPSPWALVVGGVAGTAMRVGVSHLAVIVPPRFRWERAARDELLSFGKWIFLSTVITFFAMQSDKLIGGALIPLDVFGVYSIAFALALMPKQIVNRVSRGALYPVLSQAAHGPPAALAERVVRVRSVMMPMMVVLTLGMVVGGRLFFIVLYPAEYSAAGWITQALAVFLWFSLLTEISDRVVLALGDSRALAISNAVRTAVTVAGIVAGHHVAGLPGFLAGLALGPLAGYVVIGLAMRGHGVPVLRSDALHTVAVAAVAIAALIGFDLGAEAAGTRQWLGAGLVLGGAGTWCAARTWRAYR